MTSPSAKSRPVAVTDAMPSRPGLGAAERPALTVTATEAKTRFGPLLDTAMQGRSVVITKHDVPKAVLLSIEAFESLLASTQPNLGALTGEFDDLLARLQTASSRQALDAAFSATPAELGRSAVARARRRA